MIAAETLSAQRKCPSNGWALLKITPDYTAYQKGEWSALSSLVQVEDEHLPLHWEWLVSFSRMGRSRLTNKEIAQCLRDFDAEAFEEDNHERGVARKFWYAVDPQYRKPCPCKDEMVITEGDYQFSTKKV